MAPFALAGCISQNAARPDRKDAETRRLFLDSAANPRIIRGMDVRYEVMVEGETYSCLLNAESVPYNCVRAEVSQPEPDTSGNMALIAAVSIASVVTIALVLLYNICMVRKARKSSGHK